MSASTLACLLFGVTLNATAQLALKAATRELGPLSFALDGAAAALLRLLGQPCVWLGLGCYGLSVPIWLVALSRVDVMVAYPFLSIGYVITTLAAWHWFGEPLTGQRALALAIICCGVALLSRA